MDKYKILVVEDDRLMNQTIYYNLTLEGYEVSSVKCVSEAIKSINNSLFDLAILDVNLPDGDGFSLCDALTKVQKKLKIIFLTANNQESDMLKGYEKGGIDYIVKPFSMSVLIKKIKVVVDFFNEKGHTDSIYEDEYIIINFKERKVIMNGDIVEFTTTEIKVIELLVNNKNHIIERQSMIERLWDVDGDFIDEHTLTTTISRIRKKFTSCPKEYIKTVYGLGYMWNENT